VLKSAFLRQKQVLLIKPITNATISIYKSPPFFAEMASDFVPIHYIGTTPDESQGRQAEKKPADAFPRYSPFHITIAEIYRD
jgi:hypothetical protein